uniref:FAD-binding FR-type domain-containing protein n=1 Tax=Plectus sambesii TaxID=2011161 RepID=A0A914V652_9BILA
MRGARLKINLQETESLNSFAVPSDEWTCWRSNWISKAVSLLEDYRQHIAILTIFFLFTGLFFLERFWHYRYESEHRDLRRVMGVGIAVTRGAAASMSFCFGLILLTVCRNVMTLLRETPLMHYIPFDSAITFHKIIAIVAGVFAAIHSIGHCINFYHVATQSKEGLQCLFQEAVFGSNFQPSISYWFYGTITGVTGIMLVVVMSIIYVFAAPAVLKQAYHAFHLTHFLNILLYVLIVAHGLPKLLDTPKFIYFVAGPLVIFIIDRILGMRQNYRQLQIVSAALLPSDIIHIEFKRPRHFRFRSGQWVRISCPAFSCNFNERHAFSVASAPQQTSLEMYIKAVGPWTWKLRHHIGCAQANGEDFPMLHMNGPYGDGNQEWSSHEVAVLVGGGIGVTPYASILSDLVEATSSGKHTEIKCKKNETGYNVIALLPGRNVGSSDDKITVVAANYDSLASTGGVDDNGSGVAAVLEAARVLKSVHNLCPFAHSLVFVLFDFKHKGMEGSHAFASHWLIPYLRRTNGVAGGVFVLDGLLNFDPFPTSQAIPENFPQHFPDAFRRVNEHSYMGDYLQVVGRTDVDSPLIELFRRSFAKSLRFERPWSVKKPWLLSIALPFDRPNTVADIHNYLPFLNGDHTGFWFLLPDATLNLPTIYVSDTLNYRGLMQYCSGAYCDSLNLLTDDNLHFLALAVDSTIHSVLRLAELQCASEQTERH